MEPDSALASESCDTLHLVEVEDLADHAAHRRLDRDHPDRGRYATLLGALDLSRHFRQTEARTTGRKRDQGQTAQLLRAVAGVIVDMALPLHQYPAAAARQDAQCQVVGQCPAGQEEGRLLAE